ncbi:FMN reductase (NADPH) [Halobacillus karajensis]|uniref:FMN reductase (NADPH) n=1 Tax=Halobacillus karajensis TaxID=195088 RepID=A0A024P4D6_9BACI|nr:oxygen-insensitive NADPH nitroreductase [Halobacillus karajensis]CDQ19987.1 FMN reductase (NADPH) [Halobacillus karajensis]CDQ22447.1 FMN reductase (NADPH) [Halobacillus karajensis]CDQ28290.1 FMN reductase (NADPH) [Halobacillus karajensis]SEH68632.1 FMN reductase (NADPH) [Halobacillus karajensis]
MNQTIETILNHRSIRQFKEVPVTEEQLDTILAAAQQASTSSYMMAYTIIGVTDEHKKTELAEITGQGYVKKNGHLLVFCADLYRHTLNASPEQYEQMLSNLENSEHFLVSAIDAALAAQNAAVAAESMGLGICYIGSIRNQLDKVDEILHLPKHVIPLFGMVIGVPAHTPDQKPRLPKAAVYFENEYKHDHEAELEAFDQTIAEYYQSRKTNTRNDSWTDQMLRRFTNPMRMDVTGIVKKKGFNKQ